MVRIALLLCVTTLLGCNRNPPAADKAASVNAVLSISAEDICAVRRSTLASGPAITGSVQPERRADLHAEVSAMVLQVLRENGDSVHRGDLLLRLDDTAIRESLASAEAATRASSQSFEQAERQYQRMLTLSKSGMATTQQMEDAEIRRNNTQSDLEAARTRAVQARQQLQRTEIRSPFAGIVSDRKVSAGDTVQIGKELLKVLDPTSMRFEGLVSADAIGSIKEGQAVLFRVNGYGEQQFMGRIRRLNPAANATTRQVEVIVDFADKKQPPLAGLYAEGRIESAARSSLTIPATTLVKDGDKAAVWRLKDGALQRARVDLGDLDPRSGDIVLRGGLAEGDQLIRYPPATLHDGQRVEMVTAAAGRATALVPGK